jgi:thiopurine S-methyltransferase
MDAEFWLTRWEKREIGFHQHDLNRYLEQYWSSLKLANDCTVFVPLCGKSKDMRWLAQQGHHVLGFELSETAVREFFEEWDVQPAVEQRGSFTCYSGNNVELFVGVIFALTAKDVSAVEGIYDRAALVALPPDMRREYVHLLSALLPSKTQTLLITFEYQLGDREGPPFSIPINAVNDLYAETCAIQSLESGPFDLRGVAAIEHAFRLEYH